MRYLLAICLVAILCACGDASRIMEANTYRKCSEYSIKAIVTHNLDFGSGASTKDTAYTMTYEGRMVVLTGDQTQRLDTDPTGVCREVM